MSYKVVQHVETLIKLGKGDTGRLSYILDKLKNNRPLYFTDQRYLENILKANPMPEVSDARILRETYKTNEINNELKSELKFTYEEIEKLESTINKLRKERASFYGQPEIEKRSFTYTQPPMQSIPEQPTEQVLIDEKPATATEESLPIEPPTISAVARYVQPVITVDDVIKYANKSAALRTNSGLFRKGGREEVPLAWEKFFYPYYDVKMEITLKEIEKLGSKYRSMTKVIKSRACIDGKTGAIVDGTKDGISYRYSFLKDLSSDETAFLYYVHQIDDVFLHELSGLGFSVEKLMTISDKLASKGYLKKSGTKNPRFKISKGTELPNPTKLNCITEDHVATESSSNDRMIRPDITPASLPNQLAKYWNNCNIPSSALVYYPYYGITYDRKDYYRIEIMDALTGQRQESLEHIVSVRPQNKISANQSTNKTK